MPTDEMIEYFNDLDDNLDKGADVSQRRYLRKRESRKLETDARLFARAQEISREFRFTYKAARFEEAWLLDSLVEIAEQEWISDVLRKVKGGKEASVYVCRPGAEIQGQDLVAAKIYRPRILRNLRNDGLYREGRGDLDDHGRRIVDTRKQHAMQKKTEFGRELLHQSWIAYEFTTMRVLHAAGADVPAPYVMSHNAIVMEYIGSLGMAAPALIEVQLDTDEAQSLFERTIRNIDLLLAHERIHGDLSAYNILYWEGEIRLIDFPQVVSPNINRHAFAIFRRDVHRVCEYFASQGVDCNPASLAEDLWTARGYRMPKEDPEE